ncbi:MAG: hypothetical protein HC857_12900 [Synechococcales cyanobacterium RU_4_20]|nr:hypothetical protein [Synechococcales cyanobacterium RU_4_20]NJR67415.1 hypothetical protein [Synechococcales cyanobacterium CRU_2_2]
MAKRRNLKKEKALRNEAYARKFRKRPQRGRNGRRYDSRSQNADGDEKKDDDGNSSMGMGATD